MLLIYTLPYRHYTRNKHWIVEFVCVCVRVWELLIRLFGVLTLNCLCCWFFFVYIQSSDSVWWLCMCFLSSPSTLCYRLWCRKQCEQCIRCFFWISMGQVPNVRECYVRLNMHWVSRIMLFFNTFKSLIDEFFLKIKWIFTILFPINFNIILEQ